MKRLPIIFGFIIFFTILFRGITLAQSTSKDITPPVNGDVNVKIADNGSPSIVQTPNPGDWVSDPTTTFVGKTANRSGDFLDWTLRNYDWVCVTRTADGNCSNSKNPLEGYWLMVFYIVSALLIGVIMVAAFIMIVTRGQSVTLKRFIPRFIFIVALIALSYSIIQFLYIITDVIQGFFLNNSPNLFDYTHRVIISTKDLIYIGFNYQNFEGYRRYGSQFDESAFMTLLLVRLTALTYYVMTGILIIRKIILWFLLILSPVFPLLLFFRPIRNTGKIWVGEFFRWLLYAPLFAIFLHGLVVLWSSPKHIPMAFDFSKVGQVVYPTAVNILIGGPGQKIFYISDTYSNSVNLQDTFALYIVALLMLWVVIILPFLLLKIFLDYLGGVSWQENTTVKRLLERGSAFLPGGNPPTPSPTSSVPPPMGAGRAMQLPMAATHSISESMTHTMNKTVNETHNIQNITSIPANAQILQLANLSVPKMRDIAKYETSMVSKNASHMQDVSRLRTSLHRISSPSAISSVSERERYMQVKEQLINEKQKGNVLASSILNAANTITQTTQVGGNVSTSTSREATVNQNIQIGGTSAISKLSTSIEKNKIGGKGFAPQEARFPQVNRVQQVSLEDYEEVKKMWLDTYHSSTPPGDPTGKVVSREEWIKKDIDQINQAITLLNSVDPVRSQEGMEMVSNILPFLMIGGFSKTEVIAYLKAKLEAAKSALTGDTQKKEEEEAMVGREKTTAHAIKHMSTTAEEELPTDESGSKKLEELRKKGEL